MKDRPNNKPTDGQEGSLGSYTLSKVGKYIYEKRRGALSIPKVPTGFDGLYMSPWAPMGQKARLSFFHIYFHIFPKLIGELAFTLIY